MLRKMIISGILSGIGAGLLFTIIQFFLVTPLILEAETYEQSNATASSHHHENSTNDHTEWAPEDGTERTLYTALTNVIAGIGFSLVFVAMFTFCGHSGWRAGLLWGLAGYATFYLAPALGLPPELPGTVSAELDQRQWWWIITIVSTAIGLGCIVLNKISTFRVIGIVLLLAPHLFGAPTPLDHNSLVPQELTRSFIVNTSIANLIFWCLIGVLNGMFTHKLSMVDSLQNA